MNIEYLKYFAELAKLQHYGKAAKALNISQPGLSHAIKTLEDEYGVPLFQKEGRNVSLSRYGKELMQDVEEILDAYLRMEERAAGLRTEEKTVRIGTVYPLAAGTIPHMLREFGAPFPFIIYNRLTPEIEEGLHHTKRSSQVSAGHVFQDERLPQPPRADLRRTGHPGKTHV